MCMPNHCLRMLVSLLRTAIHDQVFFPMWTKSVKRSARASLGPSSTAGVQRPTESFSASQWRSRAETNARQQLSVAIMLGLAGTVAAFVDL